MRPEERSLVATRRRAFGNIRPAGKSSWQASYKVNGQRFIAPSTFPSKADAERYGWPTYRRTSTEGFG